MNENIKIVVIPSSNEKTNQIDFVFKAVQKNKQLFYPIESIDFEQSFEKIEDFINNFDQFEKYTDREIYHFDCFRNYMKENHFELYKHLELDDSILDYMQDSYVALLLNLFRKLTEIGFISILNSDYTTIIYTPKNNITLSQQNNLDKLKELIIENKIIEIIKCDGHETEKLKGNVEIIDTYLDSLHYKREEIKKR